MRSQYPNAAKSLRNWITEANLGPGRALPSSASLAHQLGFAPTTMLRACQALVSDGSLRREGYKLRVAPNLSTKLEGPVSVVSYFEEFVASAGRILTERGIPHTLVELSFKRHPRLEVVLDKILLEKPAGLILQPGPLEADAQALLRQAKIPIVLCTALEEWNQSSVRGDIYGGVEQGLRHLMHLGHRHIAHVALPGDGMIYAFLAECLKLNLKSAASEIWRAPTRDAEGVKALMQAQLRRHPRVTALLCRIEAAIWATEIFDVPGELSVIGQGELLEGMTSKPTLTTVEHLDPDCFVRWACAEMIDQLQNLASGRPRKPATHALFRPNVVARESTRALTPAARAPQNEPRRPAAEPRARQTWLNTYPFLKRGAPQDWLQLDLTPFANHSIGRQHGWLGADPLEHFPPGLRSIHGVPFRVIDESRNDGRAVVTFRSPHSHSAGEEQLPAALRIEVKSQVKAIYFLHGCGWAKRLPFAHYRMNYENGGPQSVPLVPLGLTDDSARERSRGPKPNLQDWWFTYPQRDFPHAHHLTVFDPAEPAPLGHALYTLEWINQRPDAEVSFIDVEVDPLAGPTLALIAVTALLR